MVLPLIVGGTILLIVLAGFGGQSLNIVDRLTKNSRERDLDIQERQIAITRDQRGAWGNFVAYFVGEKAYLEAETGNEYNPVPTNPGTTPADRPAIAVNPAAPAEFRSRRGSYRGRVR